MRPDSDKALEIGVGHSDLTPKSGPGAPIVESSDRLEPLKCLEQEEVAWKSGSPLDSLRTHLEGEGFLAVVRSGCQGDTLFSKIISNIEQHPRYTP